LAAVTAGVAKGYTFIVQITHWLDQKRILVWHLIGRFKQEMQVIKSATKPLSSRVIMGGGCPGPIKA
jgi:hypothetical protein